MRKTRLASLGITLLAAALFGGQRLAQASYDWVTGRYPGSTRVASELVDLDYVGRGWLSRQASYLTGAERDVVERWYLARYGPVSEADAHGGGACLAFHTTKTLARVVYAVSVTLCATPAGTRIRVNESIFVSPIWDMP